MVGVGFDPISILIKIIIFGVPAILAITLHEAAHGFVALKYGDDTAKQQGRVTLNPLKHIDLMGAIVLPALLILLSPHFLFGYAKPVPVNFARLNNPRRDMVLVAAAGPGMNILLAIISAFLFHMVPYLPTFWSRFASEMLGTSVFINVVLAVFNMLPLPPLDGGRIAVGLLPGFLARPLAKLEKWGFFILIGLVIVLPLLLREMGIYFNLFRVVLEKPINFIVELIAYITGVAVV